VAWIDTFICVALVAFNANAFEIEILTAVNVGFFQDLYIGLAECKIFS
jgi:hypothetical protein